MGQVPQGEYYRFEGGAYDGQTLRINPPYDVINMDEPVELEDIALGPEDAAFDGGYITILKYCKTKQFDGGGRNYWYIYILVE